MKTLAASFLITGFLGACASLPDVEYSYYLSKSQTNVTVTQTLDCTTDKTALIVTNSPVVTPVYSADVTKAQHVKIRDVEGTFSPWVDSDMSFSFYDDGRLKSINQSTTGEGETIIKSAVSLASALGGGTPAGKGRTLAICDKIANWGKGKPVSLIYSGTIDLANQLGKSVLLNPADTSRKVFAALGNDPNVPVMGVRVGTAPPIASGARFPAAGAGAGADYVPLTLQSTASVTVDVTASGSSIWTGAITVPLSQTYDLPIPKAALFGKQSFALALSEAGAITTVEYAKNSGAAGALNAAGAIATAETPETTATKAADVKAQADLIAQQQRLARCQANPAQCS